MSIYKTSTFLILWMSLVIWAISLRCLSITSFKSCHSQMFSTVKILITGKQDKVIFILLIDFETDQEYPLYSVCKGHAEDDTNILLLNNQLVITFIISALITCIFVVVIIMKVQVNLILVTLMSINVDENHVQLSIFRDVDT